MTSRSPSPPPSRSAAALALVLLAACGGGEEAPGLPPGVGPLAAGARIAMPPGERRCQPPSLRKVFRDAGEWNGFWTFGFEGCPQPALPAGFDFAREMLVLASMGERASATDSIRVVGSGVVSDTVLVVVRRVTRQDGCPAGEVSAWARDLVRIPADERPVRFLEEHRKLPCE